MLLQVQVAQIRLCSKSSLSKNDLNKDLEGLKKYWNAELIGEQKCNYMKMIVVSSFFFFDKKRPHPFTLHFLNRTDSETSTRLEKKGREKLP